MEQVRAVLKPDASRREVDLIIEIDGQKLATETAIPAGGRFSLVSEMPSGEARSGGAILTFRYVLAGQHKSAILYLTPSMVARLANR